MSITANNWSNKNGTANRACKCGTWKEHWIYFANKTWPVTCSVKGCTNTPTLGAHVINPSVSGEKIIPMCSSCNGLSGAFDLIGDLTLSNANVSETCGK